MDSVSQIVLGAAVGEAVLGKRLGNKAMFWGAVGGTIPDLDIITKPLMSEIDSLAFHRGISHSFFFAILAGLGFGWLIYKLYQGPYSRNFFQIVLSLFLACIPISIVYFLYGNDWNPYLVTAAAMVVALGIYLVMSRKNKERLLLKENASLRSWQWMFFLAFATHALLDTFTMYGTQLFLPFSNYRAAIASISVADPVGYTIPFIFCLVMATRYLRTQPQRRFWNWLGLGISCTYLLFTVWNKQRITSVYEKQLAEQNISYSRLITGPTIFNNFLWSGTVESEGRYYQGQYSVFDTSPISFHEIKKQHNLLPASQDDRTINILRWFSDGFFSVLVRKDGRLQVNDLRFGTFEGNGGEDDYIFRFIVEQKADGSYEMLENRGGPDEDKMNDVFAKLWERIKGV